LLTVQPAETGQGEKEGRWKITGGMLVENRYRPDELENNERKLARLLGGNNVD
jgi:hypothetical protein